MIDCGHLRAAAFDGRLGFGLRCEIRAGMRAIA